MKLRANLDINNIQTEMIELNKKITKISDEMNSLNSRLTKLEQKSAKFGVKHG